MRLYINGTLEGELYCYGTIKAPAKYDSKATRLVIGTDPRGTSYNLATGETWYSGYIYTFRVYTSAITASQLLNNYTVDRYTHIENETVPSNGTPVYSGTTGP